MHKNTLVSILIPAYNAEKCIAQTIQSALNQTWPHKEIIIVDDGSTDNTLNIIRKFEGRSLKVMTQEKAGACHARNRAFQECQGDYIQWLDADDLLAAHKIERQLNVLHNLNNPYVLCTGPWGRFYYRPNKAHFYNSPLYRDYESTEWLITRFSNHRMMLLHCWLVSRVLSEKAGPWNERLSRNQDGEYFTRVVSYSQEVKFVPDAICFYRVTNPNSISHNRSRKALKSICLSVILESQHLLSRENNTRTKNACIQRLLLAASFLKTDAPDLADQLYSRTVEIGGNILSSNQLPHNNGIFNSLRQNIIIRKLLGFISYLHRSIQCNTDRLIFKLFGSDVKIPESNKL